MQVNTSATGKPSSGSHSPREGANQSASGVMPYLGSASGGLFHSSTTTQLQAMGHPSGDNSVPGANPDFHTIRQQIRANVLQKSKEKQEKKMMVRHNRILKQIDISFENLVFHISLDMFCSMKHIV